MNKLEWKIRFKFRYKSHSQSHPANSNRHIQKPLHNLMVRINNDEYGERERWWVSDL